MDFSGIEKVVEETDPNLVQKYLNTGRWVILSVAPGHRPDGTAYQLYSLGWYGPYDPDAPGSEHTEFPTGLN